MGQLAHSEELFSHVYEASLVVEMVPSFSFYYILCRNSPIKPANNELDDNPSKAFIKNSSLFTPTSRTSFYNISPSLTFTLILALNSTSGLILIIDRYTDKNLQKTTKLALKSFFKTRNIAKLKP